jgi:hypothetical protein
MLEAVYKDMYIQELEECIKALQEELLAKKEVLIVRQWESMCRNMKKRRIFGMADELRKAEIVELKDYWMEQRRNYWDAKEETDFQTELQLHWKGVCQKLTNDIVNLVELMLVRGNT